MPARARLCFVFVQKERDRYPASLARILGVAAELDAWQPHVVVVDNDREGDWEHRVAARLTHLGGDNTGWEFSAFDRGVRWARRHLGSPELFALVTDACLAYGDAYLDLVGLEAAELAVREQACVGWIDSFGQTCSILGNEYEAWLRTSFLLIPDEVLRRVEPLAEELPLERIFGADPSSPFAADAPVSDNLQRLITAWLTRSPEPEVDLEETWHSGFVLDAETMPFFRDKARSILREHRLSARLHALGVAAYDLRVVRRLSDLAEKASDWAWLKGVLRFRAQAEPERVGEHRIVMAGDWRDESARQGALLLAREVLPLLRQRISGVRLSLVGPTDGELIGIAGRFGVTLSGSPEDAASRVDGASVVVVAPQSKGSTEPAERWAEERGVPIVRDLTAGAPPSAARLARRLSGCLEGPRER